MSNLFISIAIGMGAALIDIIPMFFKKLDRMFILSAFLFWLMLGFLIPKTSFTQIGWLNGICTALIVLLPMLILIFKLDREAIPIICGTTVVLGAAVGFFSTLLLR